MGLSGALNIGRSALTAAQVGIQVAGNNLANAATPGYSRQVARLTPLRADGIAQRLSVGSGVGVTNVQRQIDQALQNRLWQGAADQSAMQAQSRILAQIESTINELSDADLSSELSAFFNGWSELANGTRSGAAVIQRGQQLAEHIQRLRSDLSDQRRQVDLQVGQGVARADELLSTIAQLNGAIADAETGGTTANTLRDQRDTAITELSELMDVAIVDRGREGFDVLVGSSPVVLGSRSRGLELRREVQGGISTVHVATRQDGQELTVRSGLIGGLMNGRTGAIDQAVAQIDRLASTLVHEVNRLHSTGRGASGLTLASGEVRFTAPQRTLALNDPANQATSGLTIDGRPRMSSGGFLVTVTQRSTGAQTQSRIDIDLDGITAAGLPGTTDDTSAESIRARLDGIPGLSASFTPDGRLDLRADAGFEFSFAEDSSGALATLGLNTYFRGTNGSDIAVREELLADPNRLAAGRIVGGALADNGTAIRIAQLQGQSLQSLGGRTIPGLWQDAVQGIGSAASATNAASEAALMVRESLESQRSVLSGVSVDEESMNLLLYQRQFQGAARVIAVTDEMTQTLLSLI